MRSKFMDKDLNRATIMPRIYESTVQEGNFFRATTVGDSQKIYNGRGLSREKVGNFK